MGKSGWRRWWAFGSVVSRSTKARGTLVQSVSERRADEEVLWVRCYCAAIEVFGVTPLVR
jgi:hypothetical protein